MKTHTLDPAFRTRAHKAKYDKRRQGAAIEIEGDAVARMCLNKTRYADEHTARAGAFHIFETNRNDVEQLYTYRCSNCRGWHLTKNIQPNQAPITADDLVTDALIMSEDAAKHARRTKSTALASKFLTFTTT